MCESHWPSSIHTHTFNGPFSGTTQVSWYQKGKTNLDFTEARDSEWQWHQLGHIQVCTSLQTDNHASTPPLSFLQAGCPSCRPTDSVKALKAQALKAQREYICVYVCFMCSGFNIDQRTVSAFIGHDIKDFCHINDIDQLLRHLSEGNYRQPPTFVMGADIAMSCRFFVF